MVKTRFCAEPGGCDDPFCYLCRMLPVEFPEQPLTYAQQKQREEERRRAAEAAKKKGRKKH